MGKLFGTDGIRGKANTYPMDAETALAVGRAIAFHLKKDHTKSIVKPLVVIGQDTRLSSDMLSQALAAGVCAAGVDAGFLGVLPTPGIAHLTVTVGAVAGVVLSASHNPYYDNGIKVFNAQGYKLSDQIQKQIEMLLTDLDKPESSETDQIGRVQYLTNAADQYIAFLRQVVPGLSLNKMKIVLDCANGATYQVAPVLFEQIGADVISLFCEPDGININAGCGSQHLEALARSVIKNKAHLGLAFDGDGDRLIAVDEQGRAVTGDQIMTVCAQDLKNKGQLDNNVVVSTVMSNLGFGLALKQMGIRLCQTQVGDRYVIEKMMAEKAALGGEDSGHIIFRHAHSTGDGLVAALHLIRAMQSAEQPLSQLTSMMKVFPQMLINVDVKQKPDLDLIPEITQAIARTKAALGDQGRVLVRYSGTQPKCRVMVEGPTKEVTQAYCREIVQVVEKILG